MVLIREIDSFEFKANFVEATIVPKKDNPLLVEIFWKEFGDLEETDIFKSKPNMRLCFADVFFHRLSAKFILVIFGVIE